MNLLIQIYKNENGSAMVLAVFIIVLLTAIGFAASRTAVTELQIVRNTIQTKQDFYVTEGSIFEVANDVDKGSGNDQNYNIMDINQPTLTTPTKDHTSPPVTYNTITSDGDSPENWTAMIGDYDDDSWPVSANEEYIYRVYYRGQGPIPKGYGTNFGSYIFDITVRKRNIDTDGTPVYSSVINKGHRKIGPKN